MHKSTQGGFVFLDESGKPEVYSAKGINLLEKGLVTHFLILASVHTPDQLKIQQEITAFKLQLLKNKNLKKLFSPGYTLDAFHAQADYPEIKELFYQYIISLDTTIEIIVIEKIANCEDILKNPGKMYGIAAAELLRSHLVGNKNTEIIFSRKDSKLKLQQELEMESEKIRQQISTFASEYKITYHHNPHYTHGGLQVADYCAYALFQVYEHQKFEWWSIIKDKVTKIYYIGNEKIHQEQLAQTIHLRKCALHTFH